MTDDQGTSLFVHRRRVLRAVGRIKLPDVVLPDAAPCTIGRSAGNDIVIPNDSVSRKHARIDPRGDGLVIRDLGSSNGVQVNGRRVSEKLLEDGDTITVGECIFKYRDSDGATVKPAAVPGTPAVPRAARANVQSPSLKRRPQKVSSLRLPTLTLPPAGKQLRLALAGAIVVVLALTAILVALWPGGERIPARDAGKAAGTPPARETVSPPQPFAGAGDHELKDPNVQRAKIFLQKQDYGMALAAVQQAIGSGVDTPTVRDLRDRIAHEYEAALGEHLKRADELEQQLRYRPALGALGAAIDLIGELDDPRAAEIRSRIQRLQLKAGG